MSWVKISTTSFSAAASVSVDNCFSAAYTHYLITSKVALSAANYVSVQLRAGGVTSNAANYRQQSVQADSTAISGARSTGLTSWTQTMRWEVTSPYGYNMLRLSNPFDAVRTTAWVDNGVNTGALLFMNRWVMAHDLTTSYDGIIFTPEAGATATGSITVYGLRAS